MFCLDYLFPVNIKNKIHVAQTEHNMMNNHLTNHFSILTINSEEKKVTLVSTGEVLSKVTLFLAVPLLLELEEDHNVLDMGLLMVKSKWWTMKNY